MVNQVTVTSCIIYYILSTNTLIKQSGRKTIYSQHGITKSKHNIYNTLTLSSSFGAVNIFIKTLPISYMLSEAPPNTALATSSLYISAIPACVKTICLYYNKIRWLIGRFEYFHAYGELFNGEGYLRGHFQLLMKTRCYRSLRKPCEQSKEQHTQLNIQSDFTRQMLTASRGEPENACTCTINIIQSINEHLC